MPGTCGWTGLVDINSRPQSQSQHEPWKVLGHNKEVQEQERELPWAWPGTIVYTAGEAVSSPHMVTSTESHHTGSVSGVARSTPAKTTSRITTVSYSALGKRDTAHAVFLTCILSQRWLAIRLKPFNTLWFDRVVRSAQVQESQEYHAAQNSLIDNFFAAVFPAAARWSRGMILA